MTVNSNYRPDASAGIRIQLGEPSLSLHFNNIKEMPYMCMGVVWDSLNRDKYQFLKALPTMFCKEYIHNVNSTKINVLMFDLLRDIQNAYDLTSYNRIIKKEDYEKEHLMRKKIRMVDQPLIYARFLPFNPLRIINNGYFLDGQPHTTAKAIAENFAITYNFNDSQKKAFFDVIMECYALKGITKDSESWSRPTPTLHDVYVTYCSKSDVSDLLYRIFQKLDRLEIFENDDDKCVDICGWLSNTKIIRLLKYNSQERLLSSALILDMLTRSMKALPDAYIGDVNCELRTVVIIDQMEDLIYNGYPIVTEYLNQAYRFGFGSVLLLSNIWCLRKSPVDINKYITAMDVVRAREIDPEDRVFVFGDATFKRQPKDYINNCVRTSEGVFELNSATTIDDLLTEA